MKPSTKDAIDRMLKAHNKRLDDAQAVQAHAEKATLKFMSVADTVLRGTCFSILETVGNYLRSHGHDFRLDLTSLDVVKNSNATNSGYQPSLSFVVLPKGFEHNSHTEKHFPQLHFKASPPTRKILICPGSPEEGSLSKREWQASSPNELSSEKVETLVLESLENFFQRNR